MLVTYILKNNSNYLHNAMQCSQITVHCNIHVLFLLFCVCFISKVMFVLRIGSIRQSPTCNVDLRLGSNHALVILQYSLNRVRH